MEKIHTLTNTHSYSTTPNVLWAELSVFHISYCGNSVENRNRKKYSTHIVKCHLLFVFTSDLGGTKLVTAHGKVQIYT